MGDISLHSSALGFTHQPVSTNCKRSGVVKTCVETQVFPPADFFRSIEKAVQIGRVSFPKAKIPHEETILHNVYPSSGHIVRHSSEDRPVRSET